MNSKIVLLIKIFDKEEYADAFINSGEMYCRTLESFKDLEGDVERGDIYEGATDWHQPDQVSLTISFKDKNGIEKSFPIKDLAGPLIIQSNSFNNLNLYCMYAVKVPEFEESYETEIQRLKAVTKINKLLKDCSTVGNEVLSLGQYAVVIYKVQDFIDKVKANAKSGDVECLSASIKYFDSEKFHGSFKGLEAVFRKRDIYKHQNEYRFVFGSHGPKVNRTLYVGSLNSMAFKITTADLLEKLELRLAE